MAESALTTSTKDRDVDSSDTTTAVLPRADSLKMVRVVSVPVD